MQPQEDFSANSPSEQFCVQCGSPMPRGMRFCRSCGSRLGEGPAEYTETVRFPHTTGQPSGGATTPFYASVNAPLIRPAEASCKRRRLGFTGMTWLWIVLAFFFVSGGALSAFRKAARNGPGIPIAAAPRSYFGVNGFDANDGKVTFKNVEPPGGPADKAGLVGGDIVTSFDGHPVSEQRDIMDLLESTPIGKTVEVKYLRDGISHTAQLTTISRDESNRLDREFRNRPEGRGMFGFQSNRMTIISRPETKIFGVRIDYVEQNGPAELFGIRVGDIITEFDHIPIRTPEEFLSRVSRALPRVPVEVAIVRDDERMIIPVTLGRR